MTLDRDWGMGEGFQAKPMKLAFSQHLPGRLVTQGSRCSPWPDMNFPFGEYMRGK